MSTPRPPVAIFQEHEIAAAISLDQDAVSAIESAFATMAADGLSMPPVMQILARDFGGQTCIKGAWMTGREHFAVKLASIYPRQMNADAAEANGLFVLVESATGRVTACLLDNGYLTQLRTAVAGAVAARHLAPECVDTMAVIGAGKQALWQIRAACAVRDIKHVVIWARRESQAAALARHVEEVLSVSVEVAAEIDEAVASAQLVVTTTSSREPLLHVCHLHPGLHITALGSDAKGKSELSNDLLRAVDLYVADHLGQCRAYGEIQNLAEVELREMTTLGDILSRKGPARTGAQQITIADLTGVGVQDTAIAIEAYKRLSTRSVESESHR